MHELSMSCSANSTQGLMQVGSVQSSTQHVSAGNTQLTPIYMYVACLQSPHTHHCTLFASLMTTTDPHRLNPQPSPPQPRCSTQQPSQHCSASERGRDSKCWLLPMTSTTWTGLGHPHALQCTVHTHSLNSV